MSEDRIVSFYSGGTDDRGRTLEERAIQRARGQDIGSAASPHRLPASRQN
jgi:hypothetical protein